MTEIARLEGLDGSLVSVSVSRGPDVVLGIHAAPMPGGRTGYASVTLSPEARDALREALDRAAMPGSVRPRRRRPAPMRSWTR